MKTIVVVFMPGRNGHAAAEQPFASLPHSTLPTPPVDLESPRTCLRQNSQSASMTPPFWTWFIENPRSYRA